MKKTIVFLVCLAAAGLNSCIGASADISIQADGSGRIALEYRVSQMLESLGRLDGNRSWPAIPTGRADFERSLARIPGMRLRSFSSRENRTDLLTRVVLDFSDTNALLAFLGSAFGQASLTNENNINLLKLVLVQPSSAGLNADLVSLLRQVSTDYEISISLSVPANVTVSAIPDTVSIPSARLSSQGRKASFTAGLGDLAGLSEGLIVEFKW